MNPNDPNDLQPYLPTENPKRLPCLTGTPFWHDQYEIWAIPIVVCDPDNNVTGIHFVAEIQLEAMLIDFTAAAIEIAQKRAGGN